MAVVSKTIKIHSKRENDLIDITEDAQKTVQESKIKSGTVTIFVSGSTGALTTIEFEPGLKKDFPKMLERLAPKDIEYGHEQMWHDGNGHSHVKASLVGPSITIPFTNGELMLGQWQQIVFIELDTRARNRTLVLQIMGE